MPIKVLFAFGWNKFYPFINFLKHKRKLKGDYKMPSYGEYKNNDRFITIKPSQVKRSFLKPMPYFNGSDIQFDIVLQIPYRKNIDENTNIEWKLYNINKNEITKTGNVYFEYTNINKKIKKMDSNFGKRDDKSLGLSWFRYKKAIQLDRLWNTDSYDLYLKETNGELEQIVAEFTLKCSDDFGMDYTNNLMSAGFGIIAGAIAGVIASIIYLAFFGG